MSPIASLHSIDSHQSTDLPVYDLAMLILIFSEASEAHDLWDTERGARPLMQATILLRMDMLGFTAEDLSRDFAKYGTSWASDLARNEIQLENDDIPIARSEEGASDHLRELLTSANSRRTIDLTWSPEIASLARGLADYWIDEGEARPSDATIIRTALATFQPNERIFVSISQQALFDLIPGEVEWDSDVFPDLSSLASYRGGVAWRNTKPILLLEGAFDAEVIRAVFEYRMPDLADCVSIADFTQGAEGGTGGLRRTLRTLATLEIPNTVLGLFDNDSAGREAVQLLDSDGLPPHIGHACYPEFARSYPTLGPTGRASADINGRASSIELFLGVDCLTQDGELSPVEWTGYNRRTSTYQGAILNKGAIQRAFRKKVSRAAAQHVSPNDQWSDLDVLGHFVVEQICAVAAKR